jgi:hypothetical protein
MMAVAVSVLPVEPNWNRVSSSTGTGLDAGDARNGIVFSAFMINPGGDARHLEVTRQLGQPGRELLLIDVGRIGSLSHFLHALLRLLSILLL